MPVILLLAAAAILGGVVWAALGRAGEMAMFPGDCAPLDADEVTAAYVALLRPPQALWGYNVQATEEALQLIARSLTARDVEIASLRQELADLRDSQAGQRPVPGDGYFARPAPPAKRHLGQRQVAGTDQHGGSLPPWPAVPGPGHDD